MTKDKNGVTLVSLVITIIVMLIIFGVTITSGTVLLDNSKKTKIETSLYMVKARAETLLEQYMFDGDVKSLIYFSKVEKRTDAERNFPIGYSYKMDYFSYTTKSFTHDTTISLKYDYVNNKGDYEYGLEFEERISGKKFKKDGDGNFRFFDTDERGIGIYKELFNGNQYIETKTINENGKEKIIPRYLFVKWGWDECVSQGIYKENVNGKIDNDSIVNDNDYIIVLYDLFAGNVDVAYSKGYRANGKIAYTLDSILNIDTVGE